MADGRELISEEMLQKVEDTARAQNREPAEVVEEGLDRYCASQRLEQLGEKLNRVALRKGIRKKMCPTS